MGLYEQRVHLQATDGGETWAPQEPIARQSWSGWVVFATPDSGWVGGWRSIMLRTSNGGDSWFLQPPLGGPVDVIVQIVRKGNRLWAGGQFGRYQYSLDRGATWTVENVGDNDWVWRMFFDTQEEGWRTVWGDAGHGAIYFEHTTDGGMTWERETFELGAIQSIHATETHVWVGTSGVLYRSSRSGAVASERDELPSAIELGQNYPSPFNPSTLIEYRTDRQVDVRLSVLDLLGRPVATLVNGSVPAGEHSSTWNAEWINSGAYFYRLEAGDFVETKTMLLAK